MIAQISRVLVFAVRLRSARLSLRREQSTAPGSGTTSTEWTTGTD